LESGVTDEDLPYQELLKRADDQGLVLHRGDIYGSGPPVDLVTEELLEFVLNNTGSTVLDVGCGVGSYVARLNHADKRTVGIDINEGAVYQAQKLGRDVRVMSAYDLQFPDSSFESVIMIETLEHLVDYEQALAEAARVASRSIVITVPDISVLPLMSKKQVVPWHLLEATHVNFFTPEVLRATVLRFTRSCETTSLGGFFEVDGKTMHMHIGAVARIVQ
jgi:ubiquinone/menaquinone biosynthesis C-methylase UbiE